MNNDQAKYYVFKILVGKDKRYLPFLTNISKMPKISDEAYLIMDEDSIEMTRNTVFADGVSYYDLILNSGCKILTTEQLVERTLKDENLKLEANNTFERLRALTNYKFSNFLPEHSFEILPPSLVADYAKAFALHGFQDQHPESVNIYMDLDVMQGDEHKLPQNPIDLLVGGDFGLSVAASYSLDASSIDDLTELLTQEDYELLSANKYVSKRWDEYKDRLKSGKDHQSFFTRDSGIANINTFPKGTKIIIGVEHMVAGSKLLPIRTSIKNVSKHLENFIRKATAEADLYAEGLGYNSKRIKTAEMNLLAEESGRDLTRLTEELLLTKDLLEKTKNLIKSNLQEQQVKQLKKLHEQTTETHEQTTKVHQKITELREQLTKDLHETEDSLLKLYNNFLQKERHNQVDYVVNLAYTSAMQQKSPMFFYPEDLGIDGRHDVQSWRGVGGGSDLKFIYSPNMENLQSFYHPWNSVLKDFEKDSVKLNSQSEAPNTSLKADQFINFLNPQNNKLFLGGAALVGSVASLASSDFALPTILLGAAATLLCYKYGVKKDNDKEGDKSR